MNQWLRRLDNKLKLPAALLLFCVVLRRLKAARMTTLTLTVVPVAAIIMAAVVAVMMTAKMCVKPT